MTHLSKVGHQRTSRVAREPRPDFFIIGAPKAGTTALHAALAGHASLYLSPVKEPKYYLCGDRPPAKAQQRGPGDAHSAQEWVWRRETYVRLFEAAPPRTVRGESTPFYLYDRASHARIRRDVPDAKLIVVVRDPVDRAYSNWMHLWSDGLETIPSFTDALSAEDSRVARGFAPFWHYRRLGLYGEQLADLLEVFPREHVHLLRYRDLVDRPVETVDAVCNFLGVPGDGVVAPRPENVRPLRSDTWDKRALARAVRAGAWAGQFAPPQVWRSASEPLLRALHGGGTPRPRLSPEARAAAVALFADDIAVLEQLTRSSFGDWLVGPGQAAYTERATGRQADRPA